MILYLDTSALLKLYLEEPESPHVRERVSEAAGCFTHLITWPELCAALARAVRVERITEAEKRTQQLRAGRDWQRLHRLLVDEPLVRRAGELAELHSLRGYDSVHLAAAERIAGEAGTENVLFATYDRTLFDAAGMLGLGLLH